jgi:hypothetical protein
VPGIVAPDRYADGCGGFVGAVGVGRQLMLTAVNLDPVGLGLGRTQSVWVWGVHRSATTDLAEGIAKERTRPVTSADTALTRL